MNALCNSSDKSVHFYCYAFVYYSCVSQSNHNHWPSTWMSRLVAAGQFIK